MARKRKTILRARNYCLKNDHPLCLMNPGKGVLFSLAMNRTDLAAKERKERTEVAKSEGIGRGDG
jgi:hypothetical protein